MYRTQSMDTMFTEESSEPKRKVEQITTKNYSSNNEIT